MTWSSRVKKPRWWSLSSPHWENRLWEGVCVCGCVCRVQIDESSTGRIVCSNAGSRWKKGLNVWRHLNVSHVFYVTEVEKHKWTVIHKEWWVQRSLHSASSEDQTVVLIIVSSIKAGLLFASVSFVFSLVWRLQPQTEQWCSSEFKAKVKAASLPTLMWRQKSEEPFQLNCCKTVDTN